MVGGDLLVSVYKDCGPIKASSQDFVSCCECLRRLWANKSQLSRFCELLSSNIGGHHSPHYGTLLFSAWPLLLRGNLIICHLGLSNIKTYLKYKTL